MSDTDNIAAPPATKAPECVIVCQRSVDCGAWPNGACEQGCAQAERASQAGDELPQAEVQRLYQEVGRLMVEMTTTVRGPDEWLCIPELWRRCMEERDEALAALAARGAQAGDERAAFEKAMLQAWKMSDPLHPPGQPGSYARGEYNGICAALQTVRENFDRALAARGAQAEPTAEQIKRLRDALEGECDGFDPSEDAARRVLRHLYGRQG